MGEGQKWLTSAVLIGAMTLSGCKSADVGLQTPLPTKTEQVRPAESAWQNLSARDKINRLELKQYPSIPNFDTSKELRSATAQFYFETTKYKINPEEMAANIFFVSPSKFLEEAQKDAQRDGGKPLSQEEIEDTLTSRLEMVSKDNHSFINIDLYKKSLKLLKDHNPEVVKQLGNRDFDTVVEKSVYLHIFSHMTQTKKPYSFNGFSIIIPSQNGPIRVPDMNQLIGFDFKGLREDGSSPVYINGAKEAVTEITAIIVGKKGGGYISIVDRYADGALFINMLNEKSGISDEEFLEYANGTRSIEDLFKRWGSIKNHANPDKKAAILALATVGLYTQGIIGSYDEAKKRVEDRLKPST